MVKNEVNNNMKKNGSDTSIFRLFISFFKLGIMTFGGGYAMIPLMQKEFVENKGWISDDEMAEMIAVSESTPGPLAVNAATFIGKRMRGFTGSLFSTLGVILPSFIIILIISRFLDVFSENIYLKYVFFGLRAGVLALVIRALIIMAKKAPRNILSYCIIAGAFTAEVIFGIHTVIILIASAGIGIAAVFLSGTDSNKEKRS